MSTNPIPQFNLFRLPTGERVWIPADMVLRLPDRASLQPGLLHYLIYIPWDDTYMGLIDPAYRDFFRTVLPYLVKELLCTEPGPVDEQVVQLAFILHDSGWSQMTEQEVADSLGVG